MSGRNRVRGNQHHCSAAQALVIVPLLVHGFRAERYGIWALSGSITLGFTELSHGERKRLLGRARAVGKSRVLITGAEGRIGSILRREFEETHHITCLDITCLDAKRTVRSGAGR